MRAIVITLLAIGSVSCARKQNWAIEQDNVALGRGKAKRLECSCGYNFTDYGNKMTEDEKALWTHWVSTFPHKNSKSGERYGCYDNGSCFHESCWRSQMQVEDGPTFVIKLCPDGSEHYDPVMMPVRYSAYIGHPPAKMRYAGRNFCRGCQFYHFPPIQGGTPYSPPGHINIARWMDKTAWVEESFCDHKDYCNEEEGIPEGLNVEPHLNYGELDDIEELYDMY